MCISSAERWSEYKVQVLAGLAELQFKSVYSGIEKAKPTGDGWTSGLCPLHDDKNSSFSYEANTGNWTCHAKCGGGSVFDFEMKRSGNSFRKVLVNLGQELGLEPPTSSRSDNNFQTYDYIDEKDQLLSQVVRKPNKKWSQRKPDGLGGWINNIKGVRRVLYRLPDIFTHPDETVYIVEGEKDADRLASLGLLATTSPGGAGKWNQSYSQALVDRNIIILPDNDAAGRAHATQVAESLIGKAKSVRIVVLPDLPEKGDVSDWLDAGGNRQQLEKLVEQVDLYTAQPHEPNPGHPSIQVNSRQQVEVFEDAWRAIHADNDPPYIFTSANHLARVAANETGPTIEFLDEPYAYGTLVRVADWIQIKGDKTIDAKPPRELAKEILSRPHPDLPKLDSVVATPVFDASGRLLATPGYHSRARLWLQDGPWLAELNIPDHPTDGQVADSVQLICQEMLYDFPFTNESDEAHAIAAFLLPFVRRMILGPTPIHLIEAATPGSGKSLMADLTSIVSVGEPCEPTTVTKNEDESRKKLTAILGQGPPIICIDNVHDGLDSGQLAAAITAMRWKDRRLGKTEMVVYPNRALWIVTANNLRLSMEMARRCLRIRIEPAEERPWERHEFKHDPIREWAQEHRTELVRALLIMIQSWIAAGQPPGEKVLGSFEAWSRVIGGILRHVGITEFLQDTDSFYEAADSESRQWRIFVHTWWEKYDSNTASVRELIALAEAHDLVTFAYAAKSDQSQRMRFGRALSGLRGRRFGDLQIVVAENSAKKVNAYRVIPVQGELLDDKRGI